MSSLMLSEKNRTRFGKVLSSPAYLLNQFYFYIKLKTRVMTWGFSLIVNRISCTESTVPSLNMDRPSSRTLFLKRAVPDIYGALFGLE